MNVELDDLIADAARSGWAPEPSRRLAEEIETRIVVPMSSRLRTALGHDEASSARQGYRLGTVPRTGGQPTSGRSLVGLPGQPGPVAADGRRTV